MSSEFGVRGVDKVAGGIRRAGAGEFTGPAEAQVAEQDRPATACNGPEEPRGMVIEVVNNGRCSTVGCRNFKYARHRSLGGLTSSGLKLRLREVHVHLSIVVMLSMSHLPHLRLQVLSTRGVWNSSRVRARYAYRRGGGRIEKKVPSLHTSSIYLTLFVCSSIMLLFLVLRKNIVQNTP